MLVRFCKTWCQSVLLSKWYLSGCTILIVYRFFNNSTHVPYFQKCRCKSRQHSPGADKMADLDDLTHCAICFEEYSQDSHIPRILPCIHTVCEPCLKSLIERTPQRITCAECRKRHYVGRKGVHTFQQNQYILGFLRSQKMSG